MSALQDIAAARDAGQIRHVGAAPDAAPNEDVTLAGGGLTVCLMTMGAVLRDLRLDGITEPLTVGSPLAGGAYAEPSYTGALVGPVANRTAGSVADIDGTLYQIPANEGPNALHGGGAGMHRRAWTITGIGTDWLELELAIAHLSDSWPGNRLLKARWSLPGAGTLALELTGTTDAPTWLAPAQHSYWRLGPGDDIAGHVLTVPADSYTAVDAAKIATGILPDVTGTAFDFRAGRQVGPGTPIVDHNLCITPARGPLRRVAVLEGALARLTLESTEPGLQVYDGLRMDRSGRTDLTGRPMAAHAGLALEPQLWPDSARFPGWHSPLLLPGETYRQETRWRLERV